MWLVIIILSVNMRLFWRVYQVYISHESSLYKNQSENKHSRWLSCPQAWESLPVLIVWLIIICAYFLSENGPVFCYVTKTLKQHGCPGDFEIPVLLGIPAWENIEKIYSFHALAAQERSDKTLHSSEMPSQRLGLLQIIEGKQITLPEKKKKKEDAFHHSPIKFVTIKVVSNIPMLPRNLKKKSS